MPNDCKGCAELRAALEDVRSSVEDYVRKREEWVLTEAKQKLDKALAQQPAAERVAKAMYMDDKYRYLEPGEIIREGDEVEISNGWHYPEGGERMTNAEKSLLRRLVLENKSDEYILKYVFCTKATIRNYRKALTSKRIGGRQCRMNEEKGVTK